MKTAVFPGSFDPVTNGHLDLIKRSAAMFDKLIVGVLVNIGKVPLFSLEERVEMLKELTKENPNIEITSFEGLLVDFVEEKNADVIVRGLRSAQDFSYEIGRASCRERV